MSKVLELYFTSEMGSTEKLTVRNPKDSLDPAAIKAAMEQIVAANIFATKTGALTGVKSARYVDRSTTDIEL
ncbi:DUF2922 domain-containing protein [Bacillus sp. FJAT-52991]|uniref:DUF2922 domain-containing protein n=1 Tax=Bacillus kandeliae TaxID=3129297 RepID=A0ABZ2NBZ6_9BACI